jgi:hypothetical protein
MSKLPRISKVVLPILRGHNDLENPVAEPPLSTDWTGLTIGTWGEDIDYRTFPHINIRRLGGLRNPKRPTLLGLPVIEMTAYTNTSLPDAEQLYEDALEVLFDAVKRQTQTDAGYLHSMIETMGGTQFSSLYQSSWRIQGLIKFGLRPPRTN